MKRIVITILLFFVFSGAVWSQTATSSPSASPVTPTVNPEEKQIQDLKEKIATKVATLREKDNKAIAGVVQDVSGGIMKLKSTSEIVYDVKLDDALTKYFAITGNVKKEIKQPDIKKGSYAIVLGVITDKAVSANAVYTDIPYVVKVGKVTEVNSEDFFLKVATIDKANVTVDVENGTRITLIALKTDEEERIGFSKIKEGDTIHFVAENTNADAKEIRYQAIKILIIPQEYFMK